MKVRTVFRSSVMFAAALALLVAVMVVSRTAFAQPAQTVKLKWADSSPVTHYLVTQAAKPWMDRVVALSKTKVEFQFYPGEQLGKLSDMVNILRTGVADIGFVTPAGVSGDWPLHTFLALPGLFANSPEGTRCFQAMLKEGPLRDEFTQKGLRPLIAHIGPPSEIFSIKKPIVKLEDVKGMKLRSNGGSMDLATKALGASPVQIPPPDLSTALQRGTVDGAVLNYASAQTYKLVESCKYATFGARFPRGTPAWGINEKVWQRLPDDVRKAMTMADDEITVSVSKWQDDQVIQLASTFEKAGMQINRLSADEQARWAAHAFAPVIEQWVKSMDARGLPGQQVVDSYKKAVGR